MRSSANPIYAPAWFLQMGISTSAVMGQRRRTERGLSSPQEAPLAQPGCELGAGRRSNDAADWKVRAPRFAPAFTDRIPTARSPFCPASEHHEKALALSRRS